MWEPRVPRPSQEPRTGSGSNRLYSARGPQADRRARALRPALVGTVAESTRSSLAWPTTEPRAHDVEIGASPPQMQSMGLKDASGATFHGGRPDWSWPLACRLSTAGAGVMVSMNSGPPNGEEGTRRCRLAKGQVAITSIGISMSRTHRSSILFVARQPASMRPSCSLEHQLHGLRTCRDGLAFRTFGTGQK